MLSNLHTHTTFCDGKDSAESIIQSAIEKGFCSLGFSAHAFTPFDLTYCAKDTDGYIAEIKRLKQKYKTEIQIYLGTEEDILCHANRSDYDYIIGSAHYFEINGKFYSIDCGVDGFKDCLKLFGNDVCAFAEKYFSVFCDYILSRKPDIVGHFDLITKYDEIEPLLLNNAKYNAIAEKYLSGLLNRANCVFEVNTGAIAKKLRTFPYPAQNLLRLIAKSNSEITLNSDCHDKNYLDYYFDETKYILKDIGFKHRLVLYDGKWIKHDL